MNIDILKGKLEAYSLDSTLEKLGNPPIVNRRRADTEKYWEYVDDGIYIVNGAGVRFLSNTGAIRTLLRETFDPGFRKQANDYDIITKLSKLAEQDNYIRFAKLDPIQHIMTACGEREYRSEQSPTNELGMHFLAEQYNNLGQLGDDYIVTWIDQVSWFIHRLNECGFPYPKRLDLRHRLKDSQGYYFYDIKGFAGTYERFYEQSMEFINWYMGTGFARRPGILVGLTIKDPMAIIKYAEEKWQL